MSESYPAGYKLAELHPRFYGMPVVEAGSETWAYAETLQAAEGVWFLCPKCFLANGKQRPGVHGVVCWSPKVPKTFVPGPGRWKLVGTDIHDLSLVASSSSVHLTSEDGCRAHFYVHKGEILSVKEYARRKKAKTL